MGDVLHFYIDRTASEAFLGTALRQQSVLYIADMLGYTPIGQQAASVTLSFSLDPNAAAAITIPPGTRITTAAQSADDLIVFELDTSVSLDPIDHTPTGGSAPVLTAVGYATEGVTAGQIRHQSISLGIPNMEFILNNQGVIYGSISVKTSEGFQVVEWSYVSHLGLARPTQPVFTTYLDQDGMTHIVFGDNAAGRIPPVNAQFYVSYRYGVGVEANAVAIGAITEIVNTTSADWTLLTVTNAGSPLGGADPESVDSMRQSIPRASGRIRDRAITLTDYADLALQVPGVAKSVAYGTVYTVVHVRIAPVGGAATDSCMANSSTEVQAYLADKTVIGSTVYVDPNTVTLLWNPFFIRVMVHVQAGYNRTSVRTSVDGTIRQVMLFDAVDFGLRISIGQIYRTALAVQGVEWVDLLWLDGTEPANLTMEGDIIVDDDNRIIGDIVPDSLHIPQIDPVRSGRDRQRVHPQLHPR